MTLLEKYENDDRDFSIIENILQEYGTNEKEWNRIRKKMPEELPSQYDNYKKFTIKQLQNKLKTIQNRTKKRRILMSDMSE